MAPDLILRSGRILWVSWGGPPDPPHETQKIRPDLKIRSGGPLGKYKSRSRWALALGWAAATGGGGSEPGGRGRGEAARGAAAGEGGGRGLAAATGQALGRIE